MPLDDPVMSAVSLFMQKVRAQPGDQTRQIAPRLETPLMRPALIEVECWRAMRQTSLQHAREAPLLRPLQLIDRKKPDDLPKVLRGILVAEIRPAHRKRHRIR